MKIIDFPEQNIVFAKDQPEYLKLPAYKYIADETGMIACCWKLSFLERFKVLFTGRIWHKILTFNKPLQPQMLVLDKPDMPYIKAG